jgi:hypothetical protein
VIDPVIAIPLDVDDGEIVRHGGASGRVQQTIQALIRFN